MFVPFLNLARIMYLPISLLRHSLRKKRFWIQRILIVLKKKEKAEIFIKERRGLNAYSYTKMHL